jgi:hypothetical protein
LTFLDFLLVTAAAAIPSHLRDLVVVFGSAPMVLAGLRPDVNDLDLFVSEDTFSELVAHGFRSDEPRPGVPRIVIAEHVDAFKTWLGVSFADVYAASAVHKSSCGLRVADLRHVYAFKTARNGEKDRSDIAILEQVFER